MIPTKLNFRVWSYYDKKYLPPEFKGSEIYVNAFGHIGYTNPKNDNPCLPQDELEIEFCTSLKDVNEVNLYENDIVITYNHLSCFSPAKQIGIIKKHKEGTWYLSTSGGDYIGSLVYLVESEGFQLELIGNIHENPELLESLGN